MNKPRYKVWHYHLADRSEVFIMTGPPITKQQALSALEMHYDPERIEFLRPMKGK